MTGEPDDLLPLFFSEAMERLEKIEDVIGPESDRDQVQSARRELHTLKGAGRMMGFTVIADLCHRAETLLETYDRKIYAQVLPVLSRIRKEIEGLHDQKTTTGPSPDPMDFQAVVDRPRLTGATSSKAEIRMPVKTLNSLSDEGARMRVLAAGAAALVDRLHGIALAAESGVVTPHPQQALASVAVKMRHLALETERTQRRFDRLVEGHLQTLLSLQVQPVRPFLLGLARHARELAQSMGKEVDVQVKATESRLDRRSMEALKEVLLHLVRNAVDHGLETDKERYDEGKETPGLIVLGTETVIDRIRIFVTDDGRGINSQGVLQTAVERGFISSAVGANLGPEAILQLVFLPGFTTRKEATGISGRGIGLNAVAEAVRNVGGEVWVVSEFGHGCTITLELPIAQRGERILVIEVGGLWVALPAAIVRRIERRPSSSDESSSSLSQSVDLIDLSRALGLVEASPSLILHLTSGGRQMALLIDRVIGEEEVFIRPLPSVMESAPVMEGMALLGNGRPVPIVDVQHLAMMSLSEKASVEEKSHVQQTLNVLLVDDSRVTREMLRRLLSDAAFRVTAVEDGEAALRSMKEMAFDCLVTDIEMPGMSGLELSRHVRENPNTAQLPIVVISTLGSAEDRMAGLDAGADAYLTKQSMVTGELIDLVRRLGGGA
ncbi:MAG: response regulator [Thermoanaerobaculales bacterium]|nr:response regulator [Thermoanaerobaculales bacterium]